MTTLHGRNAMLYIGAVISEATEWHLTTERDLADDTAFGDTWKTNLAGMLGWSGSFAGRLDTASKQAFTVAIATTVAALYLYPTASTPTAYYYGNCWPTLTIDVTKDDTANISGDFTGDGVLTGLP